MLGKNESEKGCFCITLIEGNRCIPTRRPHSLGVLNRPVSPVHGLPEHDSNIVRVALFHKGIVLESSITGGGGGDFSDSNSSTMCKERVMSTAENNKDEHGWN